MYNEHILHNNNNYDSDYNNIYRKGNNRKGVYDNHTNQTSAKHCDYSKDNYHHYYYDDDDSNDKCRQNNDKYDNT